MKKLISLILISLIFLTPHQAIAKRKNKPGYDKVFIPSGRMVEYNVELDTIPTVFNVVGKGGKIDCYLFDNNQKILTKDTSVGNNCIVAYRVPVENTYIFIIANYGKSDSFVELETN
jgi:hypothetical protein